MYQLKSEVYRDVCALLEGSPIQAEKQTPVFTDFTIAQHLTRFLPIQLDLRVVHLKSLYIILGFSFMS